LISFSWAASFSVLQSDSRRIDATLPRVSIGKRDVATIAAAGELGRLI